MIGIDVDGVLAAYYPAILSWHNRVYGISHTVADMTTNRLAPLWKCSREEVLSRIEEFYKSEEFVQMPTVDGAVEGVKELVQRHKLVIVTARPLNVVDLTDDWLERNFPDMFDKRAYVGDHYTKPEVCKHMGLKILVDDSQTHFEDAAKYGVFPILFGQPYNRNVPQNGFVRTESWSHVVRVVDEKAKLALSSFETV